VNDIDPTETAATEPAAQPAASAPTAAVEAPKSPRGKPAGKASRKSTAPPASGAAVAEKPSADAVPKAAKRSPAPKKAKPAAKVSEPRASAGDTAPVATAVPTAASKTEPSAAKPPKLKARLVRDSFTIPQADFDLIGQLKTRALGFQRPAKKSELLRAGLHALVALDDAALRQALDALVPLKAGRPKKTD
jgi:hypothetical protein